MTSRKRTPAQERRYVELLGELGEMEIWVRDDRLKRALIPDAWAGIEREVAVRPRKVKLTAAFDADLVKWYRGMGLGYQARMNAVLRAFMLALMSKEIEGRGDRDWKGDPI